MSFEGQKLAALFKMSFKSGCISLSETVCLCTENCLLGVLMFVLYLNFQSEGTTNHQYLLPRCFFYIAVVTYRLHLQKAVLCTRRSEKKMTLKTASFLPGLWR